MKTAADKGKINCGRIRSSVGILGFNSNLVFCGSVHASINTIPVRSNKMKPDMK